MIEYTVPTTDVRAWLDEEFPEQDVVVEHTSDCDCESYGDACVGGCPITEAAS